MAIAPPTEDEDVPTEWAEEVHADEVATSDTVQRQVPDPDAAPAPPGLYPGAVLRGRFVLQSRLGASGMSEVYKALDQRRREAGADNPWVAIKVVSPASRRYTEALRLLQQEAALAQRLEHPHIVRIHDFDRDGEHAFITMEWLDGESLAELLNRQRHRPLTQAHARQIVAEVGDALQFAHARAVTHADVKPGNVFITRDGVAKLLDFGIARSISGESLAADARTPAYASCEVLEGEPATPQDDLYSLACVAYRMVAGHRPFGGLDALEAERNGSPVERPRGLDDGQWQALARALAFRRAARSPDVASFLAGFCVPAAPVIAPPRASPPQGFTLRLTPPWLAAAAALALLAVVVTLWRGPEEPQSATPAAAPPAPATTPVSAPPAPSVKPAEPVANQTPVKVAAAPAVPARAAAREAAPRAVTPPARQSPERAQPQATRPREATPPAPVVAAVARAPAPESPAAESAPSAIPQQPPALTPEAPAAPATAAAVDTGTATVAAAPVAAESGPQEVPLSALRFRRYVEPEVRRRAREAEVPGWVEVGFVVGSDGEPREIRIVDSNPPGRYDKAALGAVSRWRFEPATEDGRKVERRTGVRLRFQPE